MKAIQSPLLQRMLKDDDARAELRKLLTSGETAAKIFFRGRYYTINKVLEGSPNGREAAC